MERVTAKPLIGPVPNWSSASAAKRVVTFASIIVLKARLKPLSIALIIDLPDLNSSLILSKIRTFASTDIPIVRTIPAIPGKVNVASNSVNMPNKINKLIMSVILVINPNILYLTNMKIITNKNPIARAMIPALIES